MPSSDKRVKTLVNEVRALQKAVGKSSRVRTKKAKSAMTGSWMHRKRLR